MKTKTLIKMTSGECEAYEVLPDREGKFPAVLMYMDAIGVRDALLDLAQNIADEGFVVLVPNLFYRQHTLPLVDYPEKFDRQTVSEKVLPKVKPYMQLLTPDLLLDDAQFYLKHLLHHSRVNSLKVGIVGYCFGGGHAVRTAATYSAQVSGVISLHGGNLVSDQSTSPHLFVSKVKGPMYFGHADQDQSMTSDMIKKLEDSLKDLKIKTESEVYVGAQHGFTQKDLPAYNKQASEKSLRKTIEFLK